MNVSRVCCYMLRFALLLCLASYSLPALSQTLPDRPDPSLSAVVSRYEQWRGGAAFTRIDSLHATGQLATGGMKGTTEIWSTNSGKARQDVDLGPVKQQTVVNEGHGWTNNLNGQVDKMSEAESADATRDGALLFDVFLHEPRGGIVTLEPRSTVRGQVVDVLRVAFRMNTYDFLIALDGRLVEIDQRLNGHTTLTVFDDWRMLGGVRFPFVERVTGDTPSDTSETKVVTAELNPHTREGIFSEPLSRKTTMFSRGVTSSGWLPFEFFGGTRIFIPAEINGIATTVMLDSGASSTVVDRAYALSLGLKPEGEMTAQGTGGASTLSVLNGVTLKLGLLSLSDQTMVTIDLQAVQAKLGHQLPIILGNEIFHDAVVDIDFEQHRICFRDPATFEVPKDARVVPTAMQNSFHVLEVSIEGRPAVLEFDLGNGSPLALFPRFWQGKGFLDSRPTSTTLTGGLGGLHVQQIAMVKSLSIAESEFTSIPATFEGTQSEAARSGRLDGNLGMPLLSRFHLVVDFSHDRILFAPPVERALPFQIDHSGMILLPATAGLKVLFVAPKSPAETAGLKVDDLIVSENGRDMAQGSQPDSQLGAWRYGTVGEICALRLSDGRLAHLVLAQYF